MNRSNTTKNRPATHCMDLRKKEICKHYSAHISHKHQKDKKESPKKTLKSTPNGKRKKEKRKKKKKT